MRTLLCMFSIVSNTIVLLTYCQKLTVINSAYFYCFQLLKKYTLFGVILLKFMAYSVSFVPIASPKVLC